MIRPPRAISELIEIVRRYPVELGEAAVEALKCYGAIAFEPLLELCRDPAVTGYQRSHAIGAAIAAAGADPARRARLAEVIRPYLAEAMERLRELTQSAPANEDVEEDEEDQLAEAPVGQPSDDRALDMRGTDVATQEPSPRGADAVALESSAAQDENELDLYGQVWFHVSELSALADPMARDLIQTAFDEDLVERFWIDEKTVEKRYQAGGAPPEPVPDWLRNYRDNYQQEMDDRKRPPGPLTLPKPRHPSGSVEHADPPVPIAQETIRNEGPRLGRNDPCWCGSGKKYKKCHLGKDSST
jgi:hypothetical protein